MNSYVSGSLVRTTVTFTNMSGSPADPTTIILKYQQGAGNVTTNNSPNRDSMGVYHVDLDTSGWTGPDFQLWTLQWSGTGALQAIVVDSFQVTPAAF